MYCSNRGRERRRSRGWYSFGRHRSAPEVSKASVNKAITALKAQGMVEQSHYGRVRLTSQGREIGSAVWRRHRMLRAFLAGELGVDFERADAEACLMEHALSEDTMNRWLAYLESSGITIEG